MMKRIGLVLLLGVAAAASAQDFPVEPAKPAATATASPATKPSAETDPPPSKPAFAKTPAAVVAPVMDAAAVTPVPVMAEGAETTPLSLLGQSVKPGTRSELRWASGQSFDGTVVTTPVIVVHGPTVGPRICLTAAVHGDELNGIDSSLPSGVE